LERNRVIRSRRVTPRESAEPQQFRAWIARRFGLRFDDSKLEFLAEVLDRRAERSGLATHEYLNRLQSAQTAAELQALAFELTVPETYFFRHMDQFRAFAEVALPAARTMHGATSSIRMLSAGCATGEEPYSLAMMARERGAGNVDIHALDISSAALAKAARGIYSPWALRETSADSQKRWFKEVGKEFELDASIRRAITFHTANLSEDAQDIWAAQRYDIIFCRNVLMYFTEDAALELINRLTSSLVPAGHLFLGHAETLRGFSDEYHLCHTHGTFYYQRKPALNRNNSAIGGDKPMQRLPETVEVDPSPVAADAPGEWPVAGTWLQTIEQASERIRALTERPAASAARREGPMVAAAVDSPPRLHAVLELLKEERFAEALDLLGAETARSVQDPDSLLLRAALLTHSGQLAAAEHASARLLVRDEFNAGAHYLLALCRESAGDHAGALQHDRTAIYLDSSFAMPRLHLGLMARRAGDRDVARRELTEALRLLKREDASRLLLFGGGFGREALIALCHAELKSAGTPV
jgi:chemotaxis protein methyltransferase CheR